MLVNKSMFPVQAGYRAISSMQEDLAKLQMQLGSGKKASTLAEMGSDRSFSLSLRGRLTRLETYSEVMTTVNLRLSFLDQSLSALGKLKSEARTSATPTSFGENDVILTTLQKDSENRLGMVIDALNANVGGRYLMGGRGTETAPLRSMTEILEGKGSAAGFKTVVNERNQADLGVSGLGRLTATYVAPATSISLSEETPKTVFGFKLSNPSTSNPSNIAAGMSGDPANLTVDFLNVPNAEETVTIGLELPDGTSTSVTLKAVDGIAKAEGEFQIVHPADPTDPTSVEAAKAATAQNFRDALVGGTPAMEAANIPGSLERAARTTLVAASTYAASQNFFNADGEPVLRVDGSPSTATGYRVGSSADTVQWYSGEMAPVGPGSMGRLETSNTGTDTVNLSERSPVSEKYGFAIAGVATSNTAAISVATTPRVPGPPAVAGSASVQFTAQPVPGDTVTVTLNVPGGPSQAVTLKAIQGIPGPGEFAIGGTIEETTDAFEGALHNSIQRASSAIAGNPRESATAQIDDATSISYGSKANEVGPLELMRTLASMTVQSYPKDDPDSKGRFSAMVERQMNNLAGDTASKDGSVEVMAMELGVVKATIGNVTGRATAYKGQMETMLGTVENISREETAMKLLAVQTNLTASYQVTASVSQLSLVHYLR